VLPLLFLALAADPSVADLTADAEKGDPAAQTALSFRYRDGQGVTRDYAAALKWAHLAADKGHPAALDAVGWHFYRGLGVPQNFDVSAGYFRAAAKKGNPFGQQNLGASYFSGSGVEQDYKLAFEWWEKAAKQGSAAAMLSLGTVLAAGDGIDRDEAKAAEWCEKAAAAGNPDALLLLGELKRRAGKFDEAKEVWEKAAAAKSPAAADLLKLLTWRDRKPEPDKFAFVDFRHIHQGWNNCGCTSSSMFARFQGSTATPYDLKRLCPANPIGTGTDWSDIIAAAGKLKMKWKLLTFPHTEEGFAKGTAFLRGELDAGRPVVIDFTYPAGGHTLLCVGYSADENVYVLRDPARPSPGLRILPAAELEKLWHSRYYSRVATERVRPVIVVDRE
jgi:hypothetical protein